MNISLFHLNRKKSGGDEDEGSIKEVKATFSLVASLLLDLFTQSDVVSVRFKCSPIEGACLSDVRCQMDRTRLQNSLLVTQVRDLLAGVGQEALHYIVNKYRFGFSH